MPLVAGNLLWARKQIAILGGTTIDFDTGLQQTPPNADPPLGVSAASPPPAGTPPASRIQVMPLSPISRWSEITHGEPYLNTDTNTIHVEFTNNGFQDWVLNVLFWDPHTIAGPGEATVYDTNAVPPAPALGPFLQIPIQYANEARLLAGDSVIIGATTNPGVTAVTLQGNATPFIVDPIDGVIANNVPAPPPGWGPSNATVTLPPWPAVSGNNLYNWSRWRIPAPSIAKQNDPRWHGYSLALNNGTILVFGGDSNGSGPDDKQCWIFNPPIITGPNTWALTGSMAVARTYFAAAKLADGKILACGGIDAGTGLATNTAEVYDPILGTWTNVGNMTAARQLHTAILLDNGKVLVVGGLDAASTALASAELYDPGLGTFSAVTAAPATLFAHSAVKLNDTDGNVITISANTGSPSFGLTYRYNVVANTWTTMAPMITGRVGNQLRAKLLPSGKILTVAGATAVFPQSDVTEIFDPVGNSWTSAAVITEAVTNCELFFIPLYNALVMAGGFTPGGPGIYSLQCLVYDEIGDAWNPPPGVYNTPRASSNNPIGIWDPLITPVIGNFAYVIGGDGGGGVSTSVDQFRATPL